MGEQLHTLVEFAALGKPLSAFLQIGIFLEIGGSLSRMQDRHDHDVVFLQNIIQMVRSCNEASHAVGWCHNDTNERMFAEKSRRLLDLLGEGNAVLRPN